MKLRRRTFLAGCGIAATGVWLARRRPAIEWDAHADDGRVRSVAEMPDSGAQALDFFALGDIGWNSPERASVVQRMIAIAPEAAPSFVALLGDNFYREGVRSVDDPLWQTNFEQSFPADSLNFPFIAALGNHDHNGDPDAQVAYTQRSTRWCMPGRCHSFERSIGSSAHRAAFFVVDTTPIRTGFLGGGDQAAWLADALERCTATWRIVIGHHPMLSHGEHGGTPEVVGAFAELFERHRVDFYLSGHDHDLQLVRSRAGWCQIVSGAGSTTREVARGAGTVFALSEPGFAWLRLAESHAHVQFVSAASEVRSTYRVERATFVS